MVQWAAFRGSLHWPASGVGGVSYIELPFFYEFCAGERLVLEKTRDGEEEGRIHRVALSA